MSAPRSLRRRRSTMLLTAAVVLTLTSGAAAAAVDPEDKVYPSELPTVAQVASVYPAYVDGSREVLRHRTPETPSKNCLYYRTPVEAADGKWAYYLDADGDDPYWDGEESPAPFRYRMSTRDEAKDAYRIIRRHHVRCEGTYTDDDGTVVRRKLVEVPDLAAQQFGVRTYNRVPNVITTWSYSRTIDIWVRKGRDLVKTMVQAEEYRPDRARAVDLTRITLSR